MTSFTRYFSHSLPTGRRPRGSGLPTPAEYGALLTRDDSEGHASLVSPHIFRTRVEVGDCIAEWSVQSAPRKSVTVMRSDAFDRKWPQIGTMVDSVGFVLLDYYGQPTWQDRCIRLTWHDDQDVSVFRLCVEHRDVGCMPVPGILFRASTLYEIILALRDMAVVANAWNPAPHPETHEAAVLREVAAERFGLVQRRQAVASDPDEDVADEPLGATIQDVGQSAQDWLDSSLEILKSAGNDLRRLDRFRWLRLVIDPTLAWLKHIWRTSTTWVRQTWQRLLGLIRR